MDLSQGGVLGGVDHEVFGDLSIGLLGGFSYSKIDKNALSSSGWANTYSIDAYGNYSNDGGTSVHVGGIFNWHDIEVDRTFSAAGLSQYLSASYNARSYQAFAEINHKVEVKEWLSISPFAGLSHVQMETDGFTETGGSAALTAPGSTLNTTYTTVGVRGEILQLNAKAKFTFNAGWQRGFGDTGPATNFTIADSSAFTTSGAGAGEHDVLPPPRGCPAAEERPAPPACGCCS